jgi:TonB family protein
MPMTRICVILAACAIAANPLAAQFADGPGVTVYMGGASLIHRPALTYPDAARLNGVAGTVSVEATLDAAGNVADAHVVTGPQELRRTVLTSVLQWHFARGEAGRTRKVDVEFRPVAPNDAPAPRPEPVIVMTAPVEAPAAREVQRLQERMNSLAQQNRSGAIDPAVASELASLSTQIKALQKVGPIQTLGIDPAAAREILSMLPLHEGDSLSQESMNAASAAVRQYDEHLALTFNASGEVANVRIAAPGATAPATIKVGGNVQQANVLTKVAPVYPPAARAAGVQGTVILNTIISKEGYVREIRLTSGDPALAQAAVDAVKQWTYKPTMLNGNPVEVETQVQVNFTLAE